MLAGCADMAGIQLAGASCATRHRSDLPAERGRASSRSISTATGGPPSATRNSTRLIDTGARRQPQAAGRAGAAGARAGVPPKWPTRRAAAAERRARRSRASSYQRERHLPAAARRLDPATSARCSSAAAGSSISSARTGRRSKRRSALPTRRAGRRRCRPRAARQQRGAQLPAAGAPERPARRGAAHAGAARGNAEAGARPRVRRPRHPAGAAPERRRPARSAPADRGAAGADRSWRSTRSMRWSASPTSRTLDARRRWPRSRPLALQRRTAGRPAGPPRRHRRRALARRGRDAATSPTPGRSSIPTST